MEALGGTFRIGDRTVHRMGYGAMQLCGPGVFGPPRDPGEALAVLREAISLGIDHIDTSDYYGPHLVNQLIREALEPYPDNLLLVTKLGARRDDSGDWLRWNAPAELEQGIRDNMEHLGIEAVEIANLRAMFSPMGPAEGSLAPQLDALVRCKEMGILKHIGVSNVTPTQLAEARAMTEIACVQNAYNLANRGDDEMIDELADAGIPYVPFFPLGGFNPLQSATLDRVAESLGATPMQVALAWLLQRSPNVLLIPGTSSRAHLRENIAAAELELPADAVAELDTIGG